MAAPDSETSVRPLRIFLVENHADTRIWLARYLEQMGHVVSSAVNMTEALAAISACRTGTAGL